MKSLFVVCLLLVCAAGLARAADEPSWNMNATAIEACSCPMFCQCYFNPEPGSMAMSGMSGMDHMDHFCKFNNAYKVNKGTYGATKLDGAKFWIYGDLGGDFSKGEMNWAVVTFDKAMTQPQRDAVAAICGKLFPVHWKSLKTAEGDISWTAEKGAAHALLDGGKTAEVQLGTTTLNPNTKGAPIVIQNLKYWGAPRNDGFVLMPNVVEALRAGDQAYEFKGTNGFMITIDLASKDFMAANADAK
jgi:hypothetical protein